MPQVFGHRHRLKALTRARPLLPRGTHSRENRIEATIRGTCPTTSRKSPRRRPATSIRQWMKVCRPVIRWASTWARSRCLKAVSKSSRRSASSALSTSCSYASSTSVLLVCANATCVRCGELSAALVGGNSGKRPTVEIRPARVRTLARTVDAGARLCVRGSAARHAPAARPLGRSARPLPHARRPFVSWGCPCAAAAPKVQPSKTSRRRCNLKGTHHERHPASPLQLHHLSRYRLHLRLPASRRTNRRRLRPAVPVRRCNASAARSANAAPAPAAPNPEPGRIRHDAGGRHTAAAGALTSRVDPAPLPHQGTCP